MFEIRTCVDTLQIAINDIETETAWNPCFIGDYRKVSIYCPLNGPNLVVIKRLFRIKLKSSQNFTQCLTIMITKREHCHFLRNLDTASALKIQKNITLVNLHCMQ